ncbi:dihydrolipoyl dehydrogenase family protein [Mycolicibacterium goodii]|uniref:dihydrolipoyl dehydrogenase family protein n=1 Tax=Mycolicibacterium goodii TaxID=134601 RepID=UPI000C25D4D3|nr:NAD(P)/FAD-dependent oxidoreductase [Mycolicibacterium goodii]PJK20858.1 pyridine nucleotide-disulfide oxidoreductase [Mycolicibacterium goodii]
MPTTRPSARTGGFPLGAVEQPVYDVVVLGGGPVGQTAADRARAAGLTVAVVERELVGGECSYWACIPSKAMLRPITVVMDASRVDGAREAVTGRVDATGVFTRRDRYVTGWDDSGQAGWVKSIGAELIRGHARLSGTRRVTVEGADAQTMTITARHAVVIATGSIAHVPEVAGIADTQPWTNRHGTDSHAVPSRLAIIGGGGVGVEMATAWQGLGSEVTLLIRGDRLLPHMEPFAGEMVRQRLAESGVDVRFGVSAKRLRRTLPSRSVTLEFDDGRSLEVDEVLFAVGRRPLTDDIGLDSVGLAAGSWLSVDDTGLVSDVEGDWLYALGDVNHRALLTHQGKYQARIAVAAIVTRAEGKPLKTTPWSPHTATADHHAVPQVFFCDPEVAGVGMTADEAQRVYDQVRVVDVDLGRTVPGANFHADGYTGRARIIVDRQREVLLGATFVGPGVGELLHSATVAVVGEVPINRLWHAVPSFPTISEVWLRLLEAYRDADDV